MNRRLLIGVLVVVGIGVAGVSTLPAPGFDPSTANTEVHVRLAAAGFTDDVVDVTDERVLIRYTVPANFTRRTAALFVLRTAADVVPTVDRIVLQVYEDGRPVEQVSVETAMVHEYNDGRRSADSLLQEATVTPART
jgi:hypothetical protein